MNILESMSEKQSASGPDKVSMVKVSSMVEARAWDEFRAMAKESRQSISGILTEAITEYMARRRIRPVVRDALDQSIKTNRRLGALLVDR